MKSVLTETLGQMIQEQMSKMDKYRHDCIHCVKVLDVPMDLCFCSFKTFPMGVTAIIQCPKECINFFKEEPTL